MFSNMLSTHVATSPGTNGSFANQRSGTRQSGRLARDFPCLVRLVSGSGQVRYRLGERLVDRYLEFVGPVPALHAAGGGL